MRLSCPCRAGPQRGHSSLRVSSDCGRWRRGGKAKAVAVCIQEAFSRVVLRALHQLNRRVVHSISWRCRVSRAVHQLNCLCQIYRGVRPTYAALSVNMRSEQPQQSQQLGVYPKRAHTLRDGPQRAAFRRSSAAQAATTALVVATRAGVDRCGPGHVATPLSPTGTEEGQGLEGGFRDELHGDPDASSSPGGRHRVLSEDDVPAVKGSRPDRFVGGCERLLFATVCGLFRTPFIWMLGPGVLRTFWGALDGQQLVVVGGSGVAGTPGVRLPGVLPHVN